MVWPCPSSVLGVVSDSAVVAFRDVVRPLGLVEPCFLVAIG